MNEADLDVLRDQRDFLLASLEDLEAERAAGDIDEADYRTLEDDYTARAAAVLRALDDADRARVKAAPRRSWRRVLAAGALVAVFAMLAGALVARNAGRRDEGQTVSGVDTRSVTGQLNDAGRRAAAGDLEGAVELYDEVLSENPSNAEALTYRGWILSLDGEVADGLESMLAAATADPTYPDVHAFLAVVFFRNGLVEEAARELDRLDALDPPAAIRDLVAGLRTEVEAALTTTTTAP